MFKKKRIYNYLGDEDPLLNTRATSRCGQLITQAGGGGEPTPVPTFEVGTPVTVGVTPGRTPVKVDCQVIDSTRYVVVSITTGPGGLRWIETALVAVGSTNTAVSVGGTQLIESSGTFTWGFVKVVVLTEKKFVILSRDFGNLYGITCVINGNSITSYTPVLLTNTLQASSYYAKAVRVTGDTTRSKALMAYWTNIAAPAGKLAVITADNVGGITLGPATIVPSGGFSFSRFDLCDAHYDRNYRLFYMHSSGTNKNSPVYVYEDDTVVISTPGVNTTVDGFSLKVIPVNVSDFINASQNSTSGGEIVLTDFLGTTIKASTTTQDTRNHTDTSVLYVNDGRLFYLYGSVEPTVADREFGIEMYKYSTPSFSLIYSNAVEKISMVVDTLSTSTYGFTPTKTAVAYIGSIASAPDVIRTIVLEAGQ